MAISTNCACMLPAVHPQPQLIGGHACIAAAAADVRVGSEEEGTGVYL